MVTRLSTPTPRRSPLGTRWAARFAGRTWHTALFASGVAAAALAAVADVLGGVRTPGYSFLHHSASELSALGAPTRALVMPLALASDGLLLAFGAGVWAVAGASRARRWLAGSLIGQALCSAVATAFFPGRHGQAPQPLEAGVVLGAVSVSCLVLAIGCGAAGFRGRVRHLSLTVLLAFGALTILGVLRGAAVPAGERGALVGLQERTMVYADLLWLVAVAITLLRAEATTARQSAPSSLTTSDG